MEEKPRNRRKSTRVMKEVDADVSGGGMQSFYLLKCPDRHPLSDDMQIINHCYYFNLKQKNTSTSEMMTEKYKQLKM